MSDIKVPYLSLLNLDDIVRLEAETPSAEPESQTGGRTEQ